MMIEKIGQAAMYEQLAEECTELAQAALKAARSIRGENPCGLTPKEIDGDLTEEFTDVFICCAELNMHVDMDIWNFKMRRFENRWLESHREMNTTGKPLTADCKTDGPLRLRNVFEEICRKDDEGGYDE